MLAPFSRSRRHFSSEPRARNDAGSDRRVLEKRRLQDPVVLRRVEVRGKRHALRRDAGEERRPRARPPAARRAISASTSFSVMKPRLSIAVRSTPWRSASSTALRVALRSPSSGFGFGGAAFARRLERGELVRGLGDSRDDVPELDLDALLVELHDGPAPGSLDLDRRLRRLDDADRLAQLDLGPVLDEPLGEERELGVRVLARQDDLEHEGG